jgi:hypothetical protein
MKLSETKPGPTITYLDRNSTPRRASDKPKVVRELPATPR